MTKKAANCIVTAQVRWAATIGTFFLNVTNLRAFAGTTVTALEDRSESIREKWRNGAKESLVDPKIQQIAADSGFGEPEKFIDELSDALARRSVRLARQTVESASLVFAHSLLDGVLSDCCWISFLAKPDDWFGFVQKRKVEVGSLLTEKGNALVRQSAEDFVRQLERESMLQKLNYLHRVCAPKLKGGKLPTAWLDLGKLAEFDRLRNRIVHGRSFGRKVTDVDGRLQFAFLAGMSILMLVHDAYRLLKRKDFSSISDKRLLRFFAIVRREFPELLGLFERHAKDRASL